MGDRLCADESPNERVSAGLGVDERRQLEPSVGVRRFFWAFVASSAVRRRFIVCARAHSAVDARSVPTSTGRFTVQVAFGNKTLMLYLRVHTAK